MVVRAPLRVTCLYTDVCVCWFQLYVIRRCVAPWPLFQPLCWFHERRTLGQGEELPSQIHYFVYVYMYQYFKFNYLSPPSTFCRSTFQGFAHLFTLSFLVSSCASSVVLPSVFYGWFISLARPLLALYPSNDSPLCVRFLSSFYRCSTRRLIFFEV